ncbi:MAG: HEAT repeat domain-containing protein [Candidatus Competibacteraceae bacterium]|nr:HEAT repeat domain-containing protein [Candidatus Competibacteraceae bacterium]
MNDENSKVMVTAIQETEAIHEMIAALGGRAKSLMPWLTELLSDPRGAHLTADQILRTMSAAAKEQAPELAKSLREPDLNVRAAAAQTLETMGAAAKGQAPELTRWLHDPDENVRQAAVEMLGRWARRPRNKRPN